MTSQSTIYIQNVIHNVPEQIFGQSLFPKKCIKMKKININIILKPKVLFHLESKNK